jgi:hypothetical protein
MSRRPGCPGDQLELLVGKGGLDGPDGRELSHVDAPGGVVEPSVKPGSVGTIIMPLYLQSFNLFPVVMPKYFPTFAFKSTCIKNSGFELSAIVKVVQFFAVPIWFSVVTVSCDFL